MKGTSDKPLRFVLTGTFHSLNRGDCAMQLSTARALRKRWREARIAIHAPYPEDDRAIYGDFEVVACSRRKPMAALRAVVRAALWRFSGGRTALSAELQSYRNATAVVDLSGDGLTETFGWRCPLSHTVPLLLAHLLRTPFCLMAQTIGPFRRFRPWYRWILGRAAFITARDEETFEYLTKWKLPCPIERTADMAFLLEPGARAEAVAYLKSLGGYDPARPLVTVTPSNLHNVRTVNVRSSHFSGDLDSPRDASEDVRGSHFSGELKQSAPLKWELHTVLNAVAAACKVLASETGAQILIVPHVFGPGAAYDDRRAAESLAAMLRPDVQPLVVKDPLPPPKLKALIGLSDLFIGMRMHSVIAAVSQAVPTLALSYSPKLTTLMGRLGMERFVLSGSDLSEARLVHLARDLWRERERIRQTLSEVLNKDILSASERNLAAIERLIATLPSTQAR